MVVCGGAGGAGGSGALGVADGASSISAPISSQGDWVSVSPPCVRLFLRLIDAQCTSSGCKFTTPYSGLAVISVPVVANSLHTSQVPALVKKCTSDPCTMHHGIGRTWVPLGVRGKHNPAYIPATQSKLVFSNVCTQYKGRSTTQNFPQLVPSNNTYFTS